MQKVQSDNFRAISAAFQLVLSYSGWSSKILLIGILDQIKWLVLG